MVDYDTAAQAITQGDRIKRGRQPPRDPDASSGGIITMMEIIRADAF